MVWSVEKKEAGKTIYLTLLYRMCWYRQRLLSKQIQVVDCCKGHNTSTWVPVEMHNLAVVVHGIHVKLVGRRLLCHTRQNSVRLKYVCGSRNIITRCMEKNVPARININHLEMIVVPILINKK